jgi:hypothetical protein
LSGNEAQADSGEGRSICKILWPDATLTPQGDVQTCSVAPPLARQWGFVNRPSRDTGICYLVLSCHHSAGLVARRGSRETAHCAYALYAMRMPSGPRCSLRTIDRESRLYLRSDVPERQAATKDGSAMTSSRSRNRAGEVFLLDIVRVSRRPS